MRWRAYPADKDSGIKQLGQSPVHWEARRLKTVSRFAYGNSLAADNRVPDDYNVFGSNGIVGQHNMANTQGPCLIVGRKGSFGKIVYSERPCFAIDTTYFVDASQTSNHLRWLFYCLQWLRLDSYSKDSAVPGLAREDAYENLIPYCLPDEQRAIAAFLDRKTAHIDALIAKKERQIELLQEKRAALISHAVTKGLDPSVPMKDSGIEWLGEVPEHWNVQSLKTVALLQRGHDLPAQERQLGDIPVVSSSGTFSYHAEAKAKGPGVVTGRYGTIGKIIYVDRDYWPLNTTLYVKDFHGNSPRFIYYLLMILPFDAFSDKSAVPGVDRNDLHRLLVTCPPLDEQTVVVAYLDRETTKLDALTAKVRESIERLQEYRTALISAAVTGKIDVRGEQVQRTSESALHLVTR